MKPDKDGNQDQPILIMEHDLKLCRVMMRAIESLGYSVLSTNNLQEANHLVRKAAPSLVIIGLEGKIPEDPIFEKIKEEEQIDLLLLTADRLDLERRAAMNPREVVYKPFDTRYLCRRIQDLLA